jgi:Zinc finger, C2H2 type
MTIMDNVPSTSGSPQGRSATFDPFRPDPFDLNHETAPPPESSESWSSGGNNNSMQSPPPGEASPVNVRKRQNGGTHDNDMDARQNDGTRPESKKKRFVCPHCTRTFARSGHLQRHERSRLISWGIQLMQIPTSDRFIVRSVRRHSEDWIPCCDTNVRCMDRLLPQRPTTHIGDTLST